MKRFGISALGNQSPYESSFIETKNYFKEYRNLLYSIESVSLKGVLDKKVENKFYANFLGISEVQVKELDDITSTDNLTCPGEIEPIDHKLYEMNFDFKMKMGIKELDKNNTKDLVSVKKRREIQDLIHMHCNLKYLQYSWLEDESYIEHKQDLSLLNFSSILFAVKIYHPYLSHKNQFYKMKLLQEIHILGDQFLSDLKDKILCSMDYTGITDVSRCIITNTRKHELKKRENYLSSFIFIENKFYNDTRNTSFKDLSRVIIDWADKKGLGSFSSGAMENTRMIDLNLVIGRPYVYQHQGDCEHVLIISDIRFLQEGDSLKKISYPKFYAKGRCSAKLCMMCGISYARWIVMESNRLTHDKTYFCNKCFKSYNYIDGEKIGNFKAFEYVDPVAIL